MNAVALLSKTFFIKRKVKYVIYVWIRIALMQS